MLAVTMPAWLQTLLWVAAGVTAAGVIAKASVLFYCRFLRPGLRIGAEVVNLPEFVAAITTQMEAMIEAHTRLAATVEQVAATQAATVEQVAATLALQTAKFEEYVHDSIHAERNSLAIIQAAAMLLVERSERDVTTRTRSTDDPATTEPPESAS